MCYTNNVIARRKRGLRVEQMIFRSKDIFKINFHYCDESEIKSLILLQTNKVMEDINRIKVVLVEKKRTNKWLAEQLGVNPSTVSKWCTNSSQPDLNSLLKISDLLGVDIKELIVREYKQYLMSQGV